MSQVTLPHVMTTDPGVVHAVLGQYTNPMALEALEWRFYFVYTALWVDPLPSACTRKLMIYSLIVFIIGVYFTFPETKGQSRWQVDGPIDELLTSRLHP